MRQRWHIGYLLRGLCFFGAALATSPGTAVAQSNPIVVENQQPGSGAWVWTKLADDFSQQIKGYASATSVSQNGSLSFHVTVNPPQTYTIDFYRIGWYAGLGGRLRLHVGPLDGVTQPACPVDATLGLIECPWTPGYMLTVPSDWTSGVYAALLTNAQGFQNYTMFVVKDGRPAPFLYQQSVITDQAYNDYPNDGQTGKSLYGFNSYGANTVSGTPAAVKVSFDRPQADSGFGSFYKWELNFIRWIERTGYDVTYSTDIDTAANGAELRNHKAFLSVGHSEYWSKEMFDAAESARDAGVNLAFFGGNAVYSQVRLEPSSTAVPNRVVVEYRSFPWAPTDPIQGPTTTSEFRWLPTPRPEQTLTGLMYYFASPNTDYVVTNSSHWVYAGTGFHDGDIVRGIVGYESDSFLTNYPPPNSTNRTLLANSPFTDGSVTKYQNTSIYQAPSGAWVFASGTMSWSWALDDAFGPLRNFVLDSRIQRATANVLDQFLGTGGDFAVSASPTGQSVPGGGSSGYAVTITPSGGFSGQVNLSVSGLPADASGSFTTNPATTSSTLTVMTTASTPVGTYTLTITGVSGGLTRTTTATLVVTAPDYTLSASPPSQTVVTGASTSYAVTITPSDGFAGQVTFTVSGLPAGASGSFSPNPATTSSTLSVTTSTSTPLGSYTLTITGVGGSLTRTSTVTLVVNEPPDFMLGPSPSSRTVVAGASTSYTVTITPSNGFTGPVTFTVSGLPAGAGGSLSPNPATTSSTLSVTTGTSTPLGSYTLTIRGVAGSLTRTTTVTLVVTSLPDFTIGASPSDRRVSVSASTTYTVAITPINGFAGQVTFSISGLPAAASGGFAPNPATTSSTLSVTTSTSTPFGTYPLTITGVSGSLTHTTTITLTVTRVTFDNAVSTGPRYQPTTVTTPSFVIGSGANRAAMIMVTMPQNVATGISASLGGVSGALIPGTDSGTTATVRTLIFCVANPPSGAQTATVSWTNSVPGTDVGVITVSGADPATPCTNGTFLAGDSRPATTSVTIASTAGDLTASVAYTTGAWAAPFTNQTLKWGVDSGVAGGDIGPGTGTMMHAWTDQWALNAHAVSGANFKAAP